MSEVGLVVDRASQKAFEGNIKELPAFTDGFKAGVSWTLKYHPDVLEFFSAFEQIKSEWERLKEVMSSRMEKK